MNSRESFQTIILSDIDFDQISRSPIVSLNFCRKIRVYNLDDPYIFGHGFLNIDRYRGAIFKSQNGIADHSQSCHNPKNYINEVGLIMLLATNLFQQSE